MDAMPEAGAMRAGRTLNHLTPGRECGDCVACCEVLRIVDPMELSALPSGSYPYAMEGRARRVRLDRGGEAALQGELDRLNTALAKRFENAGVPYLVAPTTLEAGDGWRLLAEAGLV